MKSFCHAIYAMELKKLTSSDLLSTIPKGTKSTILTEAANYIRLLQQNQYRSEMDKAQLIQEVQSIGNGVIGPRAAVAIRHVANQNGVSSAVNFGEMPPLSTSGAQTQAPFHPGEFMPDNLTDRQYRCVFNSCSVGMAIATMGGSFIDCNSAFTRLSSYTKQELKATTIFNLTSREDLQGAFDMMSQLITPSNFDANGNESKEKPPVILRSSIRHRSDLGLSVSLIRGEDGVARYFNVTLVKLPSSLGHGNSRPVPATAEMSSEASTEYGSLPTDDQSPVMEKDSYHQGLHSPRYTSG
jgi:PAS domain-containing protein